MMTKVEEHQELYSPEPPAPDSPLITNPEHLVQQYGDVLFGFAASRVRDRAIAQDLVQETFLAAIKARERRRTSGKE